MKLLHTKIALRRLYVLLLLGFPTLAGRHRTTDTTEENSSSWLISCFISVAFPWLPTQHCRICTTKVEAHKHRIAQVPQ